MRLQANADTLKITYRAEFDEFELRMVAKALRNNYWNLIGDHIKEDACNDMVKKITLMLPSISTEVLKEEELGYVGVS